jgi:murein DD-endopeptidase MepM/ murein hydrolase activator NlpD
MANFGNGKLNSFGLPFCSTTYQGNSLVSSLRETALGRFNSEAFQQQGALRAICLRVQLSLKPPAGSWVTETGIADMDKAWLTVYARIPELHAHLTDPFALGNNAGNAHLQINLHPAFISEAPIGKKDHTKMPSPGEIIEVDFGDRINMTQPVYRGRLSEGEINRAMQGGAREYFSGNRQTQGLQASSALITSDINLNRKHPISGQNRPHKGVDISVRIGTNIYAMKGGILTQKNQPTGAGKYIVIAHADNTWSKYMHLSRNDILPDNSSVNQGDLIGLSGNTGGSKGPHLHLELRGGSENGSVLDPKPFIDIVLGAQFGSKKAEEDKEAAEEEVSEKYHQTP